MFTAQRRYGRNPSVVVRTKTWRDPIGWQKKAAAKGVTERVFTCSWSDWFHADADAWRDEAWAVVRKCPNLTFQILTKREDRIAEHLPADWGSGYPNVWLGVSIENNDYVGRADHLRMIPAVVRFVSYEPALGPLDKLNLDGIDWVICGGESGPGYRPMDAQWAKDVRDRCKEAGVAFFFKQSAAPRTEMGITLAGVVVREYPMERMFGVTARDLDDAIAKYRRTGLEQTYLRPGWRRAIRGRVRSLIRYYPERAKIQAAALKSWETMRKRYGPAGRRV